MNAKKAIEILKTGSREEARAVLKMLEKIWRNDDWSKKDWEIFIKDLKNFELAGSMENQTVYLMALRYPFIALGKKYFRICSDFIFRLLGHDSGRIRQCGVSLGTDFIYSLEIAKFVVPKGWRKNEKDKKRIESHRKLFISFIERLEQFRNNHCGSTLAKFDYIEELPVSICKNAEALLFEILDREAPEYVYNAHKKGALAKLPLTSPDSIYEMDAPKDKAGGFLMPKWMDCTWKRSPCGADACLFCGRMNRDRKRAVSQGVDLDSPEATSQSVKNSFKEVKKMIKEGAKKFGVDLKADNAGFKISEPPKQEKFPLCREVMDWNKMLFDLEEAASEAGAMWVETEAAADLFWYANILGAKVYRQLCNRWHIKRGDDYGRFDFKYTNKVLYESMKILKKSLNELSLWSTDQKGELLLAASRLASLEGKIKQI